LEKFVLVLLLVLENTLEWSVEVMGRGLSTPHHSIIPAPRSGMK
jgi:hypothetical protein